VQISEDFHLRASTCFNGHNYIPAAVAVAGHATCLINQSLTVLFAAAAATNLQRRVPGIGSHRW